MVKVTVHIYDRITGNALAYISIQATDLVTLAVKTIGLSDTHTGLTTFELPTNYGIYAWYQVQAVAPANSPYQSSSLATVSVTSAYQGEVSLDLPLDKKATTPPPDLPPPSTTPHVKSGGGVYYLLPGPFLQKLWLAREKYLKKAHRWLHPLI